MIQLITLAIHGAVDGVDNRCGSNDDDLFSAVAVFDKKIQVFFFLLRLLLLISG